MHALSSWPVGKIGITGTAGEVPACLVDTTPHCGPVQGSARAYARRRRHSLAHLDAEHSPQYGSWAGGTPRGLVTSPAVTSFP